MESTSSLIESYCTNHSLAPSEDCQRIYNYTQTNVPMAVMLIGPLEGSFLIWLLRSMRAQRVLEIGTFTGYSALCMAEALPENGEVVTLDVDPKTTEIAKEFWGQAKAGKKIKSFLGPALESLKSVKGSFDFVFIDADKENYPLYFDLALERLSENGVIALDNSLRDGRVLKGDQEIDPGSLAIKKLNQKIKSRSDLACMLLPLRDGLMLVQKKKF